MSNSPFHCATPQHSYTQSMGLLTLFLEGNSHPGFTLQSLLSLLLLSSTQVQDWNFSYLHFALLPLPVTLFCQTTGFWSQSNSNNVHLQNNSVIYEIGVATPQSFNHKGYLKDSGGCRTEQDQLTVQTTNREVNI